MLASEFYSIAKLPEFAISAYTFHEVIYPAYLISKLSATDFVKTLDLESLFTPKYKTIRGVVSAAKTFLNECSDFDIIPKVNFRTNHDLFVYCKKNNAGADIIIKAKQPIPVLVFYQRKTTMPILKEHEDYFPRCGSLERLLDPVVI